MRAAKIFGATALSLGMAGALAWTFRIELLLAYVSSKKPHVEPNHAVAWQQGPDSAAQPVTQRPPNVVVILADDMGFNDITVNGGGVANGAVPTPNIDGIAHAGVQLTNGYAGDATCAPSRASIMTGRYPTRSGFEFTPAPVSFARVIAAMENRRNPNTPVIFHEDAVENMPPLDKEALPSSEITIAKLLKSKGYHTLHFGKWHLGGSPGSRPEDVGFDESLGFVPGASMFLPENDPDVENSKQDFDPIDRFLWAALPYGVQYNGSPWFAPRGYMTDYLTDEAIKTVHANRNRPFFMYFAPNSVHTPLQATKEDFAALPSIQNHRLRVYAAMVRNLDRNVGRLLQSLKDEGVADNTMVIFTSDNGGAHYIALPDLNKPYRGWKATFFEGGMHVPYFIEWPGHLQAGAKFDKPVGHVDIFATAAGAAGAKLPADRKMDGVDLVPYLTGQKQGEPHDNLYWRSGGGRVLLAGGWKLQTNDILHKSWLYNLRADPLEHSNLAGTETVKLAELQTLLTSIDHEQVKPLWPSVISGPIAIDHPGGEPIKPGDEYIYWDN